MKAKGKKTTAEVVYDLYLSMSEREARALYSLTQLVGGAARGPRGVTDELSQALVDLGIKASGTHCRGSIQLPHTWEEFLGEEA